MADVVKPAVRSAMMSAIRGRDTQPELVLRRGLYSRGIRYRLHSANLPGRPDIVIRKHKTAIFVHGCFWHAHKRCRYFKLPKGNRAFWRKKLGANRERDERYLKELASAGWRVAVVWECAIRADRLLATEATAAFVLDDRTYIEIEQGVGGSGIKISLSNRERTSRGQRDV